MQSAEISLDVAGQSFIFYVLSGLDMGGGKSPCDICLYVDFEGNVSTSF